MLEKHEWHLCPNCTPNGGLRGLAFVPISYLVYWPCLAWGWWVDWFAQTRSLIGTMVGYLLVVSHCGFRGLRTLPF